ncbi:unnamed protein product, partial [Ectocarpus sp. 12 AP-2014]
MTDPQQQRLKQQLQPQQPNDPPAAAVATADDPSRPFVRMWGILSTIVVLPAAIFAVSRSSQAPRTEIAVKPMLLVRLLFYLWVVL